MKKEVNTYLDQTIIHHKSLEEIMSDGFGRYAKYIIQDRALPDIRDGLKPVQRRIIYAMYNLGLLHNKPHKKSARAVGEVIGKYHPHGDSSIYEAMVRMSQDWKVLSPIIDMHGNNGSIDGDGAAAMRYTECRLSAFGEELIKFIDKKTVNFIPNFDDSEIEPVVLPTLLPNLLINGSSGIAAGYATNIPTFNLNEVIDAIITRIDSPHCQLKSILKVMPGPDFPTGGLILNQEGILQAYETGRGKISIRGEMKLINPKLIHIVSIPFETNKSLIIRKIDELREKFDALKIAEVLDESDQEGICIAIHLKNNASFEFIRNFLYKNTDLQIAYSMNMVAIKDKKPYLMNMLFMLDAFIEHVVKTTIAAASYELKIDQDKKEVNDGILKAIPLLDEIIFIIRHSANRAESVNNLKSRLFFTTLQAEAIVNLRLYRLSNSDVYKIEEENKQLEESIKKNSLIINNETYRNDEIKKQLRNYKKLFGKPRSSQFSDEEDKIIIDQNEIIEDKNYMLYITRDGYLKKISQQTLKASNFLESGLKQNDCFINQFYTNERDKVVLVTNLGNYIVIPTFKIDVVKWKDNGIHVNRIVTLDSNEKIIFAFNYDNQIDDARILILASKKGTIKRTSVNDLNIGKSAKVSSIYKLADDDNLVGCLIVENESKFFQVGIMTKWSKNLVYDASQISLVGKNAGGVKAINFKNDEDDEIVTIFDATNESDFFLVAAVNGMKRVRYESLNLANRTSVGKEIISQPKNNKIEVINVINLKINDYIYTIDENDQLKIYKASQINIGDENTRVSNYDDKKFKFVHLLSKDNQFEKDENEVVDEDSNQLKLF